MPRDEVQSAACGDAPCGVPTAWLVKVWVSVQRSIEHHKRSLPLTGRTPARRVLGLLLATALGCAGPQDVDVLPVEPMTPGVGLPLGVTGTADDAGLPTQQVVIDRHANGQPAVVAFLRGEHRVKDEHYDPQGLKIAEVTYSDQGRRGSWKRFHPNGDVQAAYYVVGGKKQGQEWRFDEAGHRISIVPYRDGLRDGVQFDFLPTGEKRSELRWKAGEPDGPMTIFYRNGEREAVVNIVNERKHGVEVQYYTGGKVKAEVPYHFGEVEGRATNYHVQGFRSSTVEFVKGVTHGEEVRYFSSGAVRMRIQWQQGERHGVSTLYRPDGTREAEFTYVHGKIDGFERGFTRDGKVAKYVEYHADVPGPHVYLVNDKGYLTNELVYRDINKGDGDEIDYYVDAPGQPTPTAFVPEQPTPGIVRMRAPLLNDKKDGEATLFDLNGHIAARMNFRTGKMDGVEVRYYSPEAIDLYRAHTPEALYWNGQVNGTTKPEPFGGKFAHAAKPSQHKAMSKPGPKSAGKPGTPPAVAKTELRPMAKFNWEDDHLKGFATLYWPNGRPRAVFPFDDEAGTGLERRWDYQGRPRFEVPVVAGKKDGVATVWGQYVPSPDEQAQKPERKRRKSRRAKPQPVAVAKDGLTKLATITYKNDKQNGEETRFDDKGRVTRYFEWKDDLLVGMRDAKHRPEKLYKSLAPVELEQLSELKLLQDPAEVIALAKRWQAQKKQSAEDRALAAGALAIRRGTVETYFRDAPGKVQSRFPASGNGMEILYHRNGQIRMTAPLVNGQRNGTARIYDETGTLWAMVPFVNGGKQGVEKRFARTGERIAEYPYRADQPVGVARTWYADGTKQSEYNFERVGHGTEVQYHHNGEVRLRVPLVDGKRQGLAIVFTETGVKWAEIPYVHGNRQGVEVRFDNEGRRVREIVWDKNVQVSERHISAP